MSKFAIVLFVLITFSAWSRPVQSEKITYTKDMLISDVKKSATDWEGKAKIYEENSAKKVTRATKRAKEAPPKPMAIHRGEDYLIVAMGTGTSPDGSTAMKISKRNCKNNLLDQFITQYKQEISKQNSNPPSLVLTDTECNLSSILNYLDEKYYLKEQVFKTENGEWEYHEPCGANIKDIECPNNIVTVVSW